MAESRTHDVTRALEALNAGEPGAGARLLELVYEELAALARSKMAKEPPGHTLQATALVHEAFLRLGGDAGPAWQNRAHFFSAAAEAMRRILVERARRRGRAKRGGGRRRLPLDEDISTDESRTTELLELNDVLDRLESIGQRMSDVVKLRCFVGMTIEDTAGALGVSPATVKSDWAYARAWLHRELTRDDLTTEPPR